jgi:rhodanese-related sulfurtransferase
MDRYFEFITNHWMLFIALVVVIFLLIQDFFESAFNKFNSISPLEAVAHMNQDDSVIIDVREPAEFKKEHIESALNFPLAKIDEHKSELESKKNSSVLIVCQTGTRSAPACKKLSKLGFENLHYLSGGMQSWEDNKMPVKKG